MADNSFRINSSLNLNPQIAVPTNPVAGDVYYDATAGSFVYRMNGAWGNANSSTSIASAASMTSSLFTPSVVQHAMVRLLGSASHVVHGMSASFNTKKLILWNGGPGSVTIQHNSATELTANNRIVTPIAGNMTLVSGEVAQFIYDAPQLRWMLVSVGSGAGAYAPATTTTTGIVKLNFTPVNPAAPEVVTTDSAGQAVVNGLVSGSAGTGVINIGLSSADTAVNIGKSTGYVNLTSQEMNIYGTDSIALQSLGVISIGTSTESGLLMGHTAASTAINGLGLDIYSDFEMTIEASDSIYLNADLITLGAFGGADELRINSEIISSLIFASATNPASNAAQKNTLTAKNICKAWAHITGGAAPVVNDGFNISYADDSGSNIVVYFSSPMNSANYVVVADVSNSDAIPKIVNQTVNGFEVAAYRPVAADYASLTSGTPTIQVMVYGTQV